MPSTQPVPGGGPADRLRRRRVVDAEAPALVVADVRMDPGDALLAVVGDDGEARLLATLVDGNGQPCGERSFHDVSRHSSAPFPVHGLVDVGATVAGAARSDIGSRSLYWRGRSPRLGSRLSGSPEF